jgi:hypothetical protein
MVFLPRNKVASVTSPTGRGVKVALKSHTTMFLKLDNLRKTREICNRPSSSFKVGKFEGHLNGYLIDST